MSDENPKVEAAEEAPAEQAEPKAEEAPDAGDVKEEQAAAEEEAAGEGGEGEDAEEAEEGGEDAPASADKKRPADSGPMSLGYKLFNSGKEAAAYFKLLQHSTSLDTDMNEYEYRILLDLLQKGHPSADSKIGCGLRSFQVRRFEGARDADARAFFAVRKDGSAEDFSYVKCVSAIFGDLEYVPRPNKQAHFEGGRGGFRGGGRGRGDGGRSPGGRGRGGRGGRFGGRGGGGRGRGRGRY
ncbi:hypothetical protein HXX76_007309 [Chlamydomonas incerta]|uniref:Uncharacterized protein n=1 Tax=Chlamydomonas incerta TaxID=51695 RepID=A0A835T1C4_CHLIN|nr:hypothetical protein HXX76_007309 [Chlamydomonas incerta]|eukprot:KAG2435227.1 hypothetical protein HXX76_007309 [Chlamydomonas incerta]